MSLVRTPITALTFDDAAGKHIRVYYQAPNGDIKEAFFDEGSNWVPNPQNTVGTAKLNTGIAAVSWSLNGQQIRVYYLGQDSKVVERCSDGQGGWVNGSLTGKYQAAPYSKIAAVDLSKTGANIHVYYQDPTNKLRETLSGGWVEGTTELPVAFTGTSIAATVDSDPSRSGDIWLYYQDTDLTLKEKWYSDSKKGWSTGSFKATSVFPPGASLSAALWGFQNDRVASVDENNQLCVTPCLSGPWNPTVNIGQVTITLSDVALISVGGGSEPASALRLFFQDDGGAIAEYASSDGNTWSLVTQNILG
ncbi:fungal fucose-specific lectin [Pluteus cervinus]|uniref:Fungal fucose-specific lectin n=1 Tax=Pluteus cervinus TaxID=181527 RepID=A0ACD3AG46_9AGAR|nr:fungal fucose-specific lectin [Pluteus cervinus]